MKEAIAIFQVEGIFQLPWRPVGSQPRDRLIHLVNHRLT